MVSSLFSYIDTDGCLKLKRFFDELVERLLVGNLSEQDAGRRSEWSARVVGRVGPGRERREGERKRESGKGEGRRGRREGEREKKYFRFQNDQHFEKLRVYDGLLCSKITPSGPLMFRHYRSPPLKFISCCLKPFVADINPPPGDFPDETLQPSLRKI